MKTTKNKKLVLQNEATVFLQTWAIWVAKSNKLYKQIIQLNVGMLFPRAYASNCLSTMASPLLSH